MENVLPIFTLGGVLAVSFITGRRLYARACALATILDSSDEQQQEQEQQQDEQPDKSTTVPSGKPVPGATSSVWRLFQLFAAPVTACGCAWLLVSYPEAFQGFVPAIFSSYTASVSKTLPLHPKDIYEAFRFGAAWQSAQLNRNDEAVRLASEVAGRAVTGEELLSLPKLVEEMASQRSIVDRVKSAFTLVNSIWFVSVYGLSMIVLPFALVIIANTIWAVTVIVQTVMSIPFFKRIIEKLDLIKILKSLPCLFLPLMEPLLYSLSIAFLVEGSRYLSTDTMSGPYIALTGVSFFTISWLWTAGINSTGDGDMMTYMQLTGGLMALFTASCALLHQSTMLGYVTVGAIAVASGFTIYSNGWCTLIGFRSKQGMISAAMTCGQLSLVNILVQLSGTSSSYYTAPFESAVSVVGSSVFLFIVDIIAAKENSAKGYMLQTSALAIHALAGTLCGLPGMTNVALTYTGLAILTMYFQLGRRFTGQGSILWTFGFFSLLYGSALYLNRNPHLVTCVLSGGRL